jgi:uncharacterized RDD family membrane protein YckC
MWASPQEAAGPAPGVEFAGHGARLVAFILDQIIAGIAGLVLLVIGFAAVGAGTTVEGNEVTSVSGVAALIGFVFFVIALIVWLLYFPFFWARGGQTPGMRPFGLRVVRDKDGGPIGWGTAILRLIGLWVGEAVFYIGLIWIFIDKRRRGWQDLIAGTVVVHRP